MSLDRQKGAGTARLREVANRGRLGSSGSRTLAEPTSVPPSKALQAPPPRYPASPAVNTRSGLAGHAPNPPVVPRRFDMQSIHVPQLQQLQAPAPSLVPSLPLKTCDTPPSTFSSDGRAVLSYQQRLKSVKQLLPFRVAGPTGKWCITSVTLLDVPSAVFGKDSHKVVDGVPNSRDLSDRCYVTNKHVFVCEGGVVHQYRGTYKMTLDFRNKFEKIFMWVKRSLGGRVALTFLEHLYRPLGLTCRCDPTATTTASDLERTLVFELLPKFAGDATIPFFVVTVSST
jgi:hypothetical protein